MYSSLAPRLGQTTFAASSVGTADLRGGKINWGSLGSSIANAFKTTGKFLGKTASKFAKSQTFKDIKQGIRDSGLVKNVAGLAGDTLSTLVDVGRLKLENELYNLQQKALQSLNPPQTIPADQLAQILQNYNQTHDKLTLPQATITELDDDTPVPAVAVPAIEAPKKRPIIEEVVEPAVIAAPVPAPVSAPVQVVEDSAPPLKKFKLRGTGLEWQQQLSNMLGEGVRYTSTKYCY